MAVTVRDVAVFLRFILAASSVVVMSANIVLLSSYCVSSLEIIPVMSLTGAKSLPPSSLTHAYITTKYCSSCKALSRAVSFA